MAEVRDRYGPPPARCMNLAELRPHPPARRPPLASRAIDREGPIVVLKFRPDAQVDPVTAGQPDPEAAGRAAAAAGDARCDLNCQPARPGADTGRPTGPSGGRPANRTSEDIGRNDRNPVDVLVDGAGDAGRSRRGSRRRNSDAGSGRGPARAGWAVRPNLSALLDRALSGQSA